MNNNTAARLDPSAWDTDDGEDITTPALALPAHYFTRSTLDDVQLSAGPERAVFATAHSIGPVTAWDRVVQQLVDGEEPIGV